MIRPGGRRRPFARAAPLALAAVLAACSSAYYGALERFGIEKRHILVDRVEEGREAQQEAQEEFQSTLDRWKAVSGFSGGDLEAKYRELDLAHQRCEADAQAVRDRIGAIDAVAQDLFAEWEAELGQMQNPTLRQESRAKLDATKRQYATYIAAMRRSESRMEPVLTAFRDQVLFLKHNLNAQAIGSLDRNVGAIEKDVDALVREMQKSIAEADAFLAGMKG